jgi:tetraprenyl-beta-curcumene synthase
VFDDIEPVLRLVLASPDRLKFLLGDGLSTPVDLVGFLRRIVPKAASALAAIRTRAEHIPDGLLRHEALASVDGKSYHVAGAAILATFLAPEAAQAYVDVIAPLESIYDYLDNLCDRHPHVEARAYPVLHRAIADALDPRAAPRDYYACGPAGDDGGYLRELVTQTQTALRKVPNIDALLPLFERAATFYADMQTFKHLPPGERESACVAWYERNRVQFSRLDWHEFVCAAGSQFQVYAPLYAAFAGDRAEIEAAYNAYFPYVSALHVLLDSFIDQAEDHEHGELNFACVYGGSRGLRERAAFLAASARERFASLARPERHRFVLRVMVLFYLSHPKIAAQRMDRDARMLLRAIK